MGYCISGMQSTLSLVVKLVKCVFEEEKKKNFFRVRMHCASIITLSCSPPDLLQKPCDTPASEHIKVSINLC